jgi:hypothetical protein
VRKTIVYIAGYLDERTALHLEFPSGPPLTRFSYDSSLALCLDFGSSHLSSSVSLFRDYLDSRGMNDRTTHRGCSSVFHSTELCVELKSAQGPLKS